MVVQHNLTAMNANRMLGITTGQQAKSSEKLSSGYRINRAADDAAGLSISEKMRKQINGLERASTNAQDGVSSVQTAEGALSEVHSMLQRMNELSVQAANGTNSVDDREAIQAEIEQLTTEIDRVAETTKFNETYLLKGEKGTKDIYMKGHDAGLAGTLVDSGTTAEFTMDQLKPGDKYTIAGVEYRIGGEIADAEALIDSAQVGEKVIVDGIVYTLVEDAADEVADEYKLTADTIKANKLGDTSTVEYNGKIIKVYDDTIDDGFDDQDSRVIDTETAIKLVSQALQAANAIGVDNTANVTITNATAANDPWTFIINKSTAEVPNTLSFALHVGTDADMTNKINVDIEAMTAAGLGIKGLNVADESGMAATYAIDAIGDALQKVSAQRSSLGAIQNRLEHTIANLDNVVENTTAAESRIRDTDMAEEMVEYSKNNILAQAGQAMLAQANQSTQGVLSLLQ